MSSFDKLYWENRAVQSGLTVKESKGKEGGSSSRTDTSTGTGAPPVPPPRLKKKKKAKASGSGSQVARIEDPESATSFNSFTDTLYWKNRAAASGAGTSVKVSKNSSAATSALPPPMEVCRNGIEELDSVSEPGPSHRSHSQSPVETVNQINELKQDNDNRYHVRSTIYKLVDSSLPTTTIITASAEPIYQLAAYYQEPIPLRITVPVVPADMEPTSLLALDFTRILSNCTEETDKDDLALWLWNVDIHERFQGWSKQELAAEVQRQQDTTNASSRWTILSKGILHFRRTVLDMVERDGFVTEATGQDLSSESVVLKVFEKLVTDLNLPKELCYLNQRSLRKLSRKSKGKKVKSCNKCWNKTPKKDKPLWNAKAVEFAYIVWQVNRGEVNIVTAVDSQGPDFGALQQSTESESSSSDGSSGQLPNPNSERAEAINLLMESATVQKPASLLNLNFSRVFSIGGTEKNDAVNLAFVLWKNDLQSKQLNSFTDEELVFYWQTAGKESELIQQVIEGWTELSKSLLQLRGLLVKKKKSELYSTRATGTQKTVCPVWIEQFTKPPYKLWRLNERLVTNFNQTEPKGRKKMEEGWRKLRPNEKRAWEEKGEEFMQSLMAEEPEEESDSYDELSLPGSTRSGSTISLKFKSGNGEVVPNALRTISKPVRFTRTPAENSDTPFIPCLTSHPNKNRTCTYSVAVKAGENPYQIQIEDWKADPKHMSFKEPLLFLSLDETPLLIVNDETTLKTFMDHITSVSVSEIAVDVEHHSEYSFLGHTCILQVSTRTEDFILDWTSLGKRLECLNQVMTNPNVIKVFHGSDSDILWLQRDCGIYVVGLFDTYLAALELGLKQNGLNFLLEKYCNVSISKKLKKKYQRADWRIRPLPADMIHYARQDTHYLLYIYDVMRNELLKPPGNEDTLYKIYYESNSICLQVYEKPSSDPEKMLSEYTGFDHCQRAAFIGLYKWRDSLARELDVSLSMVMTNQSLIKLAENLPDSKSEMNKLWRSLGLEDDHAKYLEQIKGIILVARNTLDVELLGETAYKLWEEKQIKAGRRQNVGSMRQTWKNLDHDVQKAWRWMGRTELEEKSKANKDQGKQTKNSWAGKRRKAATKPQDFSGSGSEEESVEGEDQIDGLLAQFARMGTTSQSNSASSRPIQSQSRGSNFDSFGIDFRDLPVIPSIDELLSQSNNGLLSNKTRYSDAEDYSDTQFRLLREDYLRCLKSGVQWFVFGQFSANRNQRGGNNIKIHHDITIYEKVKIKNRDERKWVLLLSKKLALTLGDSGGKRFLPGDLLLFTADQGRTFYFALIMRDDDDSNAANWKHRADGFATVTVRFCDGCEPDWKDSQKFVTLECDAYFEPYRRVMDVLKFKDFDDFPLTKYLISPSQQRTSPLPAYLRMVVEYKLGNYVVNPSTPSCWPAARKFSLDGDQYDALKAALTQEFALIQGPPGTGKTYLGVQIIKTLIENRQLWKANGGGPIIVMCYTNHALDQFLEGILDLFTPDEAKGRIGFVVREPRIVRLGGGSQSERIADYKVGNIGKLGRGGIDILFVTTTGAAKRFKAITNLHSKILIVEEAAEVFEAHIAAAFTPHLEQLILLGDHQQLRPICATNAMCKHNLDVSLFERLVAANVKRCILTQQHRMRPQIRDLITGTIYKKLTDHPVVLSYPKMVDGMTKNLFFIDHRHFEATKPGSYSKFNQWEAEMVVQLAEYLILEGYEAPQVVVLATYMSQVILIKSLMEKRVVCQAVSVETADSYQGEENDIVLLSLVRSNQVGDIGFMRTDNRICVALSRARLGLYIVGNMALLAYASPTWRKIKTKLEGSASIGTAIKLNMCKKHNLNFSVSNPEELQQQMKTCCAKCLEEIH